MSELSLISLSSNSLRSILPFKESDPPLHSPSIPEGVLDAPIAHPKTGGRIFSLPLPRLTCCGFGPLCVALGPPLRRRFLPAATPRRLLCSSRHLRMPSMQSAAIFRRNECQKLKMSSCALMRENERATHLTRRSKLSTRTYPRREAGSNHDASRIVARIY